jgi:Tfp pilus assembly protein PilF
VQDVLQLIRQAELQINRGSLRTAVETLRTLLALDSDHVVAHIHLATCLQALLRPEEASLEMQCALRLAPDDPYVRSAAGRIELLQRSYGAAERHLDRARELAPENPDVHRLLAILYAETGHPELVLPTLEAALNAEPDNPRVKTDIATHLAGANRIEEAEAMALEALRDDPECVRAQVLLGEIRFERKDYDGARNFAVGALHIDPSHEGALTLLCLVKLQSKSVLWRWRNCVRWVGRLHSAERQELKRTGAIIVYVAVLILFASGHPWIAAATIFGLVLLLVAAWSANRLVDRMFDRELRQVRFDRKYRGVVRSSWRSLENVGYRPCFSRNCSTSSYCPPSLA